MTDQLKQQGYDIVQRTAGSNSEIDIIAINWRQKEIKLIQVKRTLKERMDYTDPKLKDKIEKQNSCLNGFYLVRFEVL